MNPNIDEAREKDFPQVLKESYDPIQQRLRVEALVTDGVDALLINPDGSVNVNVQNALVTVPYDAIYGSYPSAILEVYTYKNLGVTVATVTVTYVDATKNLIASVIKT